MDVGELTRSAVSSLRTHKVRSLLTLLGIIIGVTTLVGVASVIAGLNAYVRERVIQLSPDVFVVTKFGIIRSRDDYLEALKRPDIDYHDLEVVTRELTLAEAVAGDVGTQAMVRSMGRHLANVQVHGTTANFGAMLNLDIESGRYFTEADAEAGAAVAVIGWDVKDELFPTLDPIGRDITVGGSGFRVIGLVAQQGRTLGQSQDNQVWVPMNTFRKSWGRRNSVDFLVKARGGVAGVERSVEEVRAVMRALRHTSFGGPDPFGIVTAEMLQELWRQISAATFMFTLLISGVSLGVGGVVIANIMLVSVVERTREIGVRLAVGARKRDIRRQFLLEAAILSSGGGLVGIALGSGAALVLQGQLGFPALVTLPVLAGGMLLSTVVGVVAGYFPARSASNLAVVEALRDET
jgi:putative ABC transport system permease protein